MGKVLQLVNMVMESYTFRISSNRLNQVIGEITALHQPPSVKGKMFKIYYSKQIKVKPPTFQLNVNEPEGMHFSYERYLENKLREYFGFVGSPIRFQMKTNKDNSI
jgi:GTP-binding protein